MAITFVDKAGKIKEKPPKPIVGVDHGEILDKIGVDKVKTESNFDEWASNSEDEDSTVEIVPLKVATKIYQKVKGSSEMSIYRTIAVGEIANLAARLKGNTLSIRLEFTNGNEADSSQIENLNKLGMNNGGGYYSIHFSSITGQDAARAAGAFIYGLGITFKKVSLGVLQHMLGGQ